MTARRSRSSSHQRPQLVGTTQPVRLLPEPRRGARGPGRRRPGSLIRDRRRRRPAGPGRAGGPLRPGLALRRSRPLREGQPPALRQQLRRHVRAADRRRPRTLPTGTNLILSASFDKDGEDPPHVATGILSLYHGDKKVGEGRIKTQPGGYMIAGEGLAVGRDVGDPVTQDYPGERPSASPAARSSGSPST